MVLGEGQRICHFKKIAFAFNNYSCRHGLNIFLYLLGMDLIDVGNSMYLYMY